MKYLALIYDDPAQAPRYGTPDFARMVEDYTALTRRMKDAGVHLGGDGLKPVDTATSVRVRGGKVETMDGPFAETKEHLVGYYLIDVPDLDRALHFAAQIPGAAFGTVEVRPLIEQ